jgi:HK97 family phage major capsid protein
MPNPVLLSLLNQRAEQLATVDALMNQVDGRDLVDAERSLLDAARQRIEQIDAQIAPLQAIEDLRSSHAGALAELGQPDRPPAQPRRADGGDRTPEYRSAGHFMVDLIHARGMMGSEPDPEAGRRVMLATRAVADQKTSDTTGILPTPIVGEVVNLIDANRPLISSLGGARSLAGIPGATFNRPKITQHTTVGAQAGEKTQLPSQKMTITPVAFTKSTYGGTVDISRQDIDWTSPSAWNILIRDLADVYAVQTETAVAAAFKAAATHAAIAVATNTLADWAKALYTAAADSYANSFRMPDRVWCSLDVWAALGSLVDVAKVVFPESDGADAGMSELISFRGDVLNMPRIVVPTFAAGTCIVGPSSLFEVYEEVIGLLSVVEPSILGVQVAYGGYVAWGTLAGTGFVPLTPPAGLPVISMAAVDAPEDEGDTPKAKK